MEIRKHSFRFSIIPIINFDTKISQAKTKMKVSKGYINIDVKYVNFNFIF